ncbi:hypothetical protein KGM_200947 [Danaus plexippus plexippus]|uniref:Uncharacterized protein n=1 Tax=Danaus plexippus plexippus TaxID=278856 RepID=A0A212EVA4_DANPL|nr:hypothetical protein KGM_200947 [Danaus plexippus plexippus]
MCHKNIVKAGEIGLHLWVLTVLLTSTPEDYVPRSSKS